MQNESYISNKGWGTYYITSRFLIIQPKAIITMDPKYHEYIECFNVYHNIIWNIVSSSFSIQS